MWNISNMWDGGFSRSDVKYIATIRQTEIDLPLSAWTTSSKVFASESRCTVSLEIL